MDEGFFVIIACFIIVPICLAYCSHQNNKDRETQIKIEQIRKGDCND